MFRRLWSGLPADPEFPVDLEKLGYFINEDDEVRSIQNPDNYFKYFLSRNPRWNDRQRFAINQALQNEVHKRLEKLDMTKCLLPIGTKDPSKPHIPIFVSRDLPLKKRVVVIFGESLQDLGMLAHRVIGGAGGVNKGSLVSIVSELQKQHTSSTDPSPPGIILANMGELIWSPEGQRAVGRFAFDNMPAKSAVHNGNLITEKNSIEGNEKPKFHVHYIFDKVIPHFVKDNVGIDVIGVGDGADYVEQYLDLPVVWETWKKRINCLALVGGLHPVWELRSKDFATEFLKNKARAYATSLEPAGMPLSGPEGNPKTTTFTGMGCLIFSSGEPHFTELTLIASAGLVLDWVQEVAMTPEGEDYANPKFDIVYTDPVTVTDPDWSHWKEGEAEGEMDDKDDEESQIKMEPVEAHGKGSEQSGLVLLTRPDSS
ncbi:Arb2 domain-containing protein [Hypoxylon rubiginosum]|uniref:Arb2 domain-containing protein n=1 Tax=Hypoxylon rubiginosum TaxID=110542 RepID=A0ACB9YZK5_9PEZI|nr:Arb2 domain-containing protein [Hypoxylon rubiginosum]